MVQSTEITIIGEGREIKHSQSLPSLARTFFFELLRQTDSDPDNNNSNNNTKSWSGLI